MVCTGNPTSVLPVQTSLAHQNVLDGVVEHVAHVQHSGYVWWRYHDGVGFTAVGLAAEQFVVHPILVPLALHFRGAVFAG